jgi:hypothetical protein
VTRLPSEHRERQEPGAPASPLTRWVAALVLLFLLDAAQVLLLLPERTGELFAWPIRPSVNAAILGSAYVAGGYFFIRVLTGSPWRLVAGGFPPVIVFVWFASAATLLHLDRLNDGGPALIAWVALYVVTPLLIPAIYLAERSRAGLAPAVRELSGSTRLLLGASGAVVFTMATIAFVWPAPVIDAWPWPLTPLTMRVGATVIALYGAVGCTVALRGDAAGARIPLESQVIGLGVVLLAMLRGNEEIDWANAVAPAFAAAIATLLAVGVMARIAAGAAREGGARRG